MAKARSWVNRILGATVGISIVSALVWSFLPKPLPVDEGKSTRGPLVVTVDEDGKTRVSERYIISAPLSGTLGRVSLHAGDTIEAGATLAEIVPAASPLLDDRSRAQLQARVLASEAAVKQAEATAERVRLGRTFSEKELERVKGLVASGALAAQKLEEAELESKSRAKEAESANFAIRVARYELENARAAISRTDEESSDKKTGDKNQKTEKHFVIRSPVKGKILHVLQENEGVVAAGTALFEIGDPSAIEVVVDVLTTDAVQIKPGARVLLTRWGGEGDLEASVKRVEPSAFTKISALGVEEQRVNIILGLEGPTSAYAPLGDGFRVESKIVVFETKEALKIPSAALFRIDGGWAVFVVSGGKAITKKVKIGRRTGTEAIVEEGLSEGETVILHPSDTIKDGVMVLPR